MQFLTSATHFRGISWPLPLTRPFRAPRKHVTHILPSSRLAHHALLVTMKPSSALQQWQRLGARSEDAEILLYGGRAIAPLHTDGHASHVHDTVSNSI